MRVKDFFKGDNRTVKAKKNIIGVTLLKGVDALTYLLLVPVTLDYLNPYEYGIWLTLSSILMWIDSFDIGFGNGMRNRLAEAVAKGDREGGRIYISTTLFMLVLVTAAIAAIFLLLSPLLDWYAILGTSPDRIPHLADVVYVAVGIYCMTFILKILGNVYLAMQLPAINTLMVTLGHVISLAVIAVLSFHGHGDLMTVVLIYSLSPLAVYICAYPVTFYKVYPWLCPSFRFVRREYIRSLMGVGIQFFVLQLSNILLFSFTNILISQMFGPEQVTPYNVSYRYFSVIPMCVYLILSPMWSATTDAYAKGEIEWIKNAMRNIRKVLSLAILVLVLMTFISEFVYRIWVGKEVVIPFSLSALMGLYTAILITSLVYSNFLNGLGKLRVQTVNTAIVAILCLPLCYMLGKYAGVEGILVGLCILNVSGMILNRIQFFKIIGGKATGIWMK